MAHPQGIPQFAPDPNGPPAPAGSLTPGTAIVVGQYTVRVDRFLGEGGFAHVYLVTSDCPIPAGSSTTKHVLKRMAVPDKTTVQEVGKEVEVMRKLKSHPKIVNFIEASVEKLPNCEGYEIYILMEWCQGGGIIDMMNTRLQNRLTEGEILKIFSDVVEAVAYMHYQKPPLIHRDLKVENILLSPPQTYKLCDFGSTTIPLARIPTSAQELQILEAEINKTTTLQYRAPELVDVWSRRGLTEKIDIWALGVFLYKLCYYTTPFEDQGPLAIMSVTYTFPPYPAYSASIKQLISSMLQEHASSRPNIFQVHEQVCKLRGTSIKLQNIYGTSAPQQPTLVQPSLDSILTSHPENAPKPLDLAHTVSPMRRGRPTKPMVTPVPALECATRQTGWEVPSSALIGNVTPGFGDSFTAPVNNGFSPSFSAKQYPPMPVPPIAASSQQLFSDLVPTAPSIPSASMNSLAVEASNRGGAKTGGNYQHMPVVSSPGNFGTSLSLYNHSKSTPGSTHVTGDPPPLPTRPNAQHPSTQTLYKSRLVNREAQTSPVLLQNWINQGGFNKPPPHSFSPTTGKMSLKSSVGGPLPLNGSNGLSEQPKKAPIDLLGDYDDCPAPDHVQQPMGTPLSIGERMKNLQSSAASDDLKQFKPTKPSTPVSVGNRFSGSQASPATSEDPQMRFPSLDELDNKFATPQTFSSRDKPQILWKPTMEADSSDDEPVKENPGGDHWENTNRQRSFTGSSSPMGVNQSSLNRAATISRATGSFIKTNAEVDLISPRPQAARNDTINSLVSRYETLSTTDASSIPPEPSKPVPPSKPPKPAKVSSYATGSTTHRSNDSFSQEAAILSTSPVPQTQSPTQNRPLFKPVPPLSTAQPARSGSAGVKARPMSIATSRPSSDFMNYSRQNDSVQEDDEEERFAGVANMRNRWEHMGQGATAKPKPPRKEWAAI